MVWAVSRSLATTCEIICYFLLLRLLRCFSSAGLQSFDWLAFSQPGCPIRKSWDQFVFANPPGLSQLITSFIASKSQGILHAPLFTFFYCASKHCPIRFCSDRTKIFFMILFQIICCQQPWYFYQSLLVSLSICQRTYSSALSWSFVENNGFEPLTPCVQGRCSSQLS